MARVYAIDLKYGVEVGMGRALFAAVATTEQQAIALLTRLDELVATRGQAMAGHIRKHQPRPGDPFVVLVVDEMASLTAYMSDKAMQKEADRLLRSILSKGRAMGVVVVGALQDPRKETLPARGLFTQTVALRLRSREEVTMVLGEGSADTAPAHRISPSSPGMGYVQHEDGRTIRVRSRYWSDRLIKDVAAQYRARQDPLPDADETSGHDAKPSQKARNAGATGCGDESSRPRKPRAPRQPRTPRTARTPRPTVPADNARGAGDG